MANGRRIPGRERGQNETIYRRIVFPVLGALFVYALSGAISNRGYRWGFIFCAVSAIVLFSAGYGRGDERKKTVPGMLGMFAVAILIVVSFREKKTITDYATQMDAFFGFEDGQAPGLSADDTQQGQEAYAHRSQESVRQLEQQIRELDQNVQKLEEAGAGTLADIQELEKINSNIADLSEQTGIDCLLESEEDAKERALILQSIRDYVEDQPDDFTGLETDKTQVEFFYKMLLCRNAWHYENIIAAMRDYGIDCRAMGIDVYTLVGWDTDELLALYQMRKSQESGLPEDTKGNFRLGYNSYKADLPSYRDTLDYHDYGYTFEEKSAAEVMEILDGHIMAHYQKYIINFRE